MQLLQLKNSFIEPLLSIYGEGESQQFFYMLSEVYLGCSKIDIALQPNQIIDAEQLNKFEEAKQRLLINEPIQYIIGGAYFYGNDFEVNEHTLIPRPETEELVDWIVKDSKQQSLQILDIGTGSGCIAISLAQQLPKATMTAMDVSAEALKVAQQNAISMNVEVQFVPQDILKLPKFETSFDVVVSNPPYVRELEKEAMSANVLDYEPDSALFVANENPLVFYKKIAELFLAQAKTTAVLYFEINEYLAAELTALLYKLGFTFVEVRQDFREKDRMLKATL